MDQTLVELRNATYARFVELGRAPTAAEMARSMQRGVDDVIAGWRRLHDAHALVLNAAGAEIRMAHPFAAAPTAYLVRTPGRSWYANCAWDAFGILAALHVDGRIDCSCPDCGEPVSMEVADAQPDRRDLLYHCLVPARSWWDDIAFT